MTNDGLTPMMKQYRRLKAQHPEALLLFRCGDFYETYEDDAVKASEILGITLTKRTNRADKAGAIDMAGFPFHALDAYLPKLIRAGLRVAVCDQLEDPKTAKGVVKRGITELVTPGLVMDETALNAAENNFLAAVHLTKEAAGLAFLDISTGEFLTAEGDARYAQKLLADFAPKEVLYERGKKSLFEQCFGSKLVTYELEDWAFSERTAQDSLLRHFQTASLKGFGIEEMRHGIVAAGAILQYLKLTQHDRLSHITSIARIGSNRFMEIDKFTVRNLELLAPMGEGGKTLLDVLNRTVTPMGARLLRRCLLFPLKSPADINRRLDVVEYFFKEPDFEQLCDTHLRQIGDLERVISKAAAGRATPRDIAQIKAALEAAAPVKEACMKASDATLRGIGEKIDLCAAVRERIERELLPDPPFLVSKGGVIASGVSQELDDLRRIAYEGKDYLLQLQKKETERTGIPNLKISFNNVFGYYIEVRNTHKDKVPPTWIRKQTLVSAERYITQELKDYENKILTAQDRIQMLEAELFDALVRCVAQFTEAIQRDASLIARLDCLMSFAAAARERSYVRPVVTDDQVLDIRQGRHPVIESEMPPGERYVPNDVLLDSHKQQIIIITGPNMAGKSALLRQTALITLMAQMGSFVPAEAAHVGVADKIFTRVGAGDNISMGESTFMTEMNEAASILNNISARSLVLFDELGRGTSTYDGISIAWAIVEYLHENKRFRPRTLFATHYHELNEMEKLYPRVKNFNVAAKEIDGKVLFLRKLQRGGSEHSFGIHVARLAGMPKAIVSRAEAVLKQLETANSKDALTNTQAAKGILKPDNGIQLSFFQLDDPVLAQIRDEILHLDINNLTPVEALNKLNSIRRILKGK